MMMVQLIMRCILETSDDADYAGEQEEDQMQEKTKLMRKIMGRQQELKDGYSMQQPFWCCLAAVGKMMVRMRMIREHLLCRRGCGDVRSVRSMRGMRRGEGVKTQLQPRSKHGYERLVNPKIPTKAFVYQPQMGPC